MTTRRSPTVKKLADTAPETARFVRDYERRHKDRSGVLQAAQRRCMTPKLPTGGGRAPEAGAFPVLPPLIPHQQPCATRDAGRRIGTLALRAGRRGDPGLVPPTRAQAARLTKSSIVDGPPVPSA
jgi:hypothetical protein